VARAREIRLQDLIGRRVRTAAGKPAGRIEEVRADRQGTRYVVSAFLLGRGALRERFAIVRYVRARTETIVVRPDQLDLSDPEYPRLRCHRSELTIEEPDRTGRARGR
jgi:hypothetical protein